MAQLIILKEPTTADSESFQWSFRGILDIRMIICGDHVHAAFVNPEGQLLAQIDANQEELATLSAAFSKASLAVAGANSPMTNNECTKH